jgi:hypothetical protein
VHWLELINQIITSFRIIKHKIPDQRVAFCVLLFSCSFSRVFLPVYKNRVFRRKLVHLPSCDCYRLNWNNDLARMDMAKRNNELLCWLRFLLHRLIEFCCLALWIVTAWILDKYFIAIFPLEGLPKYLFRGLELIFGVYSLIEAVKNLIPRRDVKRYPPWWV